MANEKAKYHSYYEKDYRDFLVNALERDGYSTSDGNVDTYLRDTFYLERQCPNEDFLKWFKTPESLEMAKKRIGEILTNQEREKSNLEQEIKAYSRDLDYFSEFFFCQASKEKLLLHHVLYEMMMYLYCLVKCQSTMFNLEGTLYRNTIIECLALHTRILLDFFQHRQRYGDDLLVDFFVDGFAFSLESKAEIKIQSINKCVCHLTEERIDEKQRIDYLNKTLQISNRIKDGISSFVEKMKKEEGLTDFCRLQLRNKEVEQELETLKYMISCEEIS